MQPYDEGTAKSIDWRQRAEELRAAGKRPNTQRSYESDLKQYLGKNLERRLPADPVQLEQYLTENADRLRPKTLARRLEALSDYHRKRHLPDPTRDPRIVELMRGIHHEYNRPSRQARPLKREALLQATAQQLQAATLPRPPLVALRDRLLFVVGFQCALRSDELVRLRIEHCGEINEGAGSVLRVFLPYSKSDRNANGHTWKLTAAADPRLCPVSAWRDWIEATGLTAGPLFRAIDRWDHVSTEGLNAGSVIKLLRTALQRAGIEDADEYSSHSLRRGFATEWNEAGRDLVTLMNWVGWKDPRTALGYQTPRQNAASQLLQSWENSPLPARGATQHASDIDTHPLSGPTHSSA